MIFGVNVSPTPVACDANDCHQSEFQPLAAVSAARLLPRLCCSMPAQDEAQRQRQQERDREHARQDGRRAVHPPDSVAKSVQHHMSPLPHHTRKAAFSSRSCSHTIHFSVHFVAARPPAGSSVRLLFA